MREFFYLYLLKPRARIADFFKQKKQLNLESCFFKNELTPQLLLQPFGLARLLEELP